MAKYDKLSDLGPGDKFLYKRYRVYSNRHGTFWVLRRN